MDRVLAVLESDSILDTNLNLSLSLFLFIVLFFYIFCIISF